MSKAVAVVGAGMSGLAAAAKLAAHGFAPVVFEKSRGLGGRMATRRSGALRFDHGAQYFTAKGERFANVLSAWQADGCAAKWFDDAYVGTPAMTAPARHLAAPLDVRLQRQITELMPEAGGWALRGTDGRLETAAGSPFAAVLLAMPAPQAAALAAPAGIALPGLEQVRMAPCWALMLAFDQPVAVDGDSLRPEDHPAIAWLAVNASKPGRETDPQTLVVHATPQWSRDNLALSPAEAATALLDHVRDMLGSGSKPSHVAAHRWRYALVEKAAAHDCLWDGTARLGACGDWCLGPRVEAAFSSGEALADQVIASIGERSAA